MSDMSRRPLPPMSAIEFAIGAAFRNFFFGIRLILVWSVPMAILWALTWYLALRHLQVDYGALRPSAMKVTEPSDWRALALAALNSLRSSDWVALGALVVGGQLSAFSFAVNWQRKLLLSEQPRGWYWLRLDGLVWRYAAGQVFTQIVLGFYGYALPTVVFYDWPGLPPQLAEHKTLLMIMVAALIGFSALFTFFRLASWTAGIAVGDSKYTLRTAWARTRWNRLRFLAFSFWLVFTLIIASAIMVGFGVGSTYVQYWIPGPWMQVAAFGVALLMTLFQQLLFASVAPALYRVFAGEEGEAP